MKTGELIDSLVQEARPVRTLPGPGSLLTGLAGAALVVAAEIATVRPRADLAQELRAPALLIETALLLLAALATAFGPAVLARPAAPRLRGALAVAGLATLAGLLTMGLRQAWGFAPSWLTWTGLTLLCCGEALLFSAIPFAAGIWWLRRGASVHPIRSGVLTGLAAAALGAIAQLWKCDINAPTHVIVGHAILPALILGALGAWAGHRWLRW